MAASKDDNAVCSKCLCVMLPAGCAHIGPSGEHVERDAPITCAAPVLHRSESNSAIMAGRIMPEDGSMPDDGDLTLGTPSNSSLPLERCSIGHGAPGHGAPGHRALTEDKSGIAQIGQSEEE